MPHVSSIFPKLVSTVTIVMPASDDTINAMKCNFFQPNKMCTVLPFLKFSHSEYVLDANDRKVTIVVRAFSYTLNKSLFLSQANC